jgi:hypothetical protein
MAPFSLSRLAVIARSIADVWNGSNLTENAKRRKGGHPSAPAGGKSISAQVDAVIPAFVVAPIHVFPRNTRGWPDKP